MICSNCKMVYKYVWKNTTMSQQWVNFSQVVCGILPQPYCPVCVAWGLHPWSRAPSRATHVGPMRSRNFCRDTAWMLGILSPIWCKDFWSKNMGLELQLEVLLVFFGSSPSFCWLVMFWRFGDQSLALSRSSPWYTVCHHMWSNGFHLFFQTIVRSKYS